MRQPPRRRRRWPVFLPIGLVVLLALAWTGGWFYAASQARTQIDGWREREAQAGRVYACAEEEIGGFPFRIEVRCSDPTAEFRGSEPAIALRAKDLLAAIQIYDPSLLISEFTGPLTIADPGGPPRFVANWNLAQTSVRGTPRAPERVSVVLDAPSVDRVEGAVNTPVFKAQHAEVHGRITSGSVTDNPVIDLALRLTAAVAPGLHPLAAQPMDGDISAVLRGLQDFSPKPWSARFREIQARGGSIEITNARVQQGDVIAVGAGTLRLTARGGLDGELQVTVVEVAKVLKALGIERMIAEGRARTAIDSLDRIIPGLGAIARQNAVPGIVAGLGAVGQNTTLEGKPAVTLPLRLADGVVFLGPFRIAETPPLF
jgi:hypothetical protein